LYYFYKADLGSYQPLWEDRPLAVSNVSTPILAIPDMEWFAPFFTCVHIDAGGDALLSNERK
jgi:hypothetical protein